MRACALRRRTVNMSLHASGGTAIGKRNKAAGDRALFAVLLCTLSVR